ncbi:hypothetical protein A6C57_23410 [Fibrella sp. ES10-3-2-2]|nr:hypothetical protein A6C57_23410 [Fibrella sp. ES10-3-2-2]
MRILSAFRAWVNITFTVGGNITGPEIAEALVDLADNIEARAALAPDVNGNVGIGTASPSTKLEVIGVITARTTQSSSGALSTTTAGVGSGIQVKSVSAAFAAFMEFHVPGVAIHQIGLDTDGKIKLRPWATSNTHELVASGYNDSLSTNNTLQKRKYVMYSAVVNDHQFYGIGVLGGQFIYQIPTTLDAHIFMAGLTAATSAELMRIQGDGKVGIGVTSPSELLDVAGRVRAQGIVASGGTPTAAIGAGLGSGGTRTATLTAGSVNMAGRITLVVGTTPTTGAILATVSFSAAQSAAPKVVQLQAMNSLSASHVARVFVDNLTTTGFEIRSSDVALSASSTYLFAYTVIF